MNYQTIEKFTRLTKYDLASYLEEVNNFFVVSSPKIVKYFSGELNSIDAIHIRALELVYVKSKQVSETISNNIQLLNSLDFFELVEYIDTLKLRILYFKNVKKFLRSSKTNFDFKRNSQVQATLLENQSLEDYSFAASFEDYNNAWSDIAFSNSIDEDSYGVGKPVSFKTEGRLKTTDVTSFVDTSEDEKPLGKDFYRVLSFSVEDQDFVILNERDTLSQTIEILTSVKVNSVPEFKTLGLSEDFGPGSNITLFFASNPGRELKRLFDTDDLFVNFAIIDVKLEQDNTSIEFSVSTKIGISKTSIASLS